MAQARRRQDRLGGAADDPRGRDDRRLGGRALTPAAEQPDPSRLEIRRILLASEGRAIPREAIDFVVRLAGPGRAAVDVFSIARVHGTAFGLPTPGLLPTRREWQEQRDLVARAVKALRKRGLEAEGEVVGTRKAAARICDQAQRRGCDVIVMAADPPRNRVVADFLWSQEPYRVRRRSKLPVFLVDDPSPARTDGRSGRQ